MSLDANALLAWCQTHVRCDACPATTASYVLVRDRFLCPADVKLTERFTNLAREETAAEQSPSSPSSRAAVQQMVDNVEIEVSREMLDHNCWIVAQWYVSPDGDKLGLQATGPFASQPAALEVMEQLLSRTSAVTPWTQRYGPLRTEIVPVFAPE